MGLRAVKKVRFARGQARNRRWCAVEHRVIDWAARSTFTGGVRSSNHDRGCDRRDAWVGPSSEPELIKSEPMVGMALISTRAKWRSSLSGWSSVGKKYLTT